MACTLRVTEHEKIAKTIERWSKIKDLLSDEKKLTQKVKNLRSFETAKKERLQSELKKSRSGEKQAILNIRKEHYTPIERFLQYLNEEWEIAFETYQVLEFIFRATMASHERNLFSYNNSSYEKQLERITGTPAEKYEAILKCIRTMPKGSLLGLEDIYPTKMDYVNDVNKELDKYIAQISRIQNQINEVEDTTSPLYKVTEELKRTAQNMERWAFGKVLGQEQNRGFLSFRDGQIIMDHKNFLYFKVYILAFMGTYGEFAHRVYPGRRSLICQFAEKKLKFESGKHFDFDITSKFLSGRERFANNDRAIESLPYECGFLDEHFISYVVERNEDLLLRSGELPFHLIGNFKAVKTA